MAVEVILPRVDMDMTAGRISKWHVLDGERVEKGAVIFEIETDKAAMEVEAPAAGVIRTLANTTGASIPVGSVVAHIYAEGERQAEVPGELEPVIADAPRPAPNRGTSRSLPSAPVSEADGSRATPLARKLARDKGIPLQTIAGSGPRGRIVADDIRRATAPKPAGEVRSEDPVIRLYESGSFELVPYDGRTIARRSVEAKRTVPHFYLTVTCDIENLLAARQQLNDRPPRAGDKAASKLTVNDFLIKAMALALKRVPGGNVTWTEGGMLRHRTSDIGVAVTVDGVLFTPVIRSAEAKTLLQISKEMRDLAARARQRKLEPHEYQGGTTAISNLGMFGIDEFAAIIVPPHASILAVGAAHRRPVAVDSGIEVRTQMSCTLSCDHRAIDGALGAELLHEVKTFIETPMLMLA
jgi:pyruvate dehydrogenase E2 component (dihydrolipoamide acetyltransferase)